IRLLDEDLGRLAVEPTVNIEAYTLYLKGRRFLLKTFDLEDFHRMDFDRAIEYYEDALEIDPGYALAFAGIAAAHCFTWFFCSASDESLSRARSAADQAVKLAPGLAEGHAAKALVKWLAEKDLSASERLFTTAIDLAPKSATIHLWYGRLLNQLKRGGEALVETLKAHEIDPLSPRTNLVLGNWYQSSGQFDAAFEKYEEILELTPSHLEARMSLAISKLQQWDWVGAESEFLKAIQLNPAHPLIRLEYAEFLICQGRIAEGTATLDEALSLPEGLRTSIALEEAAVINFFLGNYERALDFAARAADVSPQLRMAYWVMALCHTQMGEYMIALGELKQSEETNDGFYKTSPPYMSMWISLVRGMACARMGDLAKARAVIAEVQALPDDLNDLGIVLAILHFEIGELDVGFEYLHQSIKAHHDSLRRLPCFPMPRAVSEDPRYADALKLMGLHPRDQLAA
ncbi:tetratricopeptide repeat protein, partial [Candidatus Bipolaricaulota bacterium]